MPTLVPTKRCNLRCRHCMRATFASEFVDIGLWDKFMHDILLNHGPQQDEWTYTGGEPTLHPRIGDLLKVHEKYNTKGCIKTNGQYAPGVEAVIKNKQYVRFIRLSLDGPNTEINDKIRGPGSFDESIRSVKAYINNGINLGLGVTIHDDNVASIEEIILLGKSLGVNSMSLWSVQQWVEVNTSDNRTKSLKDNDDVSWDQSTRQKYLETRQEVLDKYRKFFPRGLRMTGKFSNVNLARHWSCENYSNNAKFPVNIANRLVLLPDGAISACCDLYDVNYNPHKYPASPFCDEPVSDILGNIKTQTLDEIVAYKKTHFEKLAVKRVRDLDAGLLVNGRDDMCTNCAYYHYQPAKTNTIPIRVESGWGHQR